MSARRHSTRRPVRSTALLCATGMLALASCGGSDDEPVAEAAVPVTTPAPTTGNTAPRVTLPATTAQPPTTTTTTTTRPTPPTAPSTTTTTTTTSTTRPTPPAAQTTLPEEPIAPPADYTTREDTSQIGVIQIPKIGVEMGMFEGIQMPTLDLGPGHWPGSAMPGQAGNIVVAGHRVSKHAVFRNVDQLEAGDEIIFHDDSGAHTYAVREIQIIQPTDTWIINPTETPTATLFACHPPGSTAQRIAVFADLVT